MIDKTKRGTIRIQVHMLEDFTDEIIDAFHDLKIVVTRAEHFWSSDAIEYECLSDNFESLEPQYLTPYYELIRHTDPRIHYTIKRMER